MYRALLSLLETQSFEPILSTNINSSFTPELLQVKHSGRSYVTVKPSTFEVLPFIALLSSMSGAHIIYAVGATPSDFASSQITCK